MRPLLLAMKPCYADLVFEGLKKVEFRRRIASQISGHDVFIYVSNPNMELRGGFRVGEVWHGSPENVWSMVPDRDHLDKQVFDTYFRGLNLAYALEIKSVWKFEKPVGLSSLRDLFGNFVVPQSWRYLTPKEQIAFQTLERHTEVVA